MSNMQPPPGRWGSARALRSAAQQSAASVHVYHGICAWAEGQLEGELACVDRVKGAPGATVGIHLCQHHMPP